MPCRLIFGLPGATIAYIYAALGLALLFALGFMLWSLRRMKAFEVVKLGAM